jgi:aspartate aminotransferase
MAMDADLSVVDKMVLVFKERRDIVLNLIKEIPGLKTNTPEGAFYVYPEVSHYIGKSDGKTSIRNEDDLCMYILKTVQVALVPGSAFGSPNYIRISYATSNDLLIEALKRIKKALSDLK